MVPTLEQIENATLQQLLEWREQVFIEAGSHITKEEYHLAKRLHDRTEELWMEVCKINNERIEKEKQVHERGIKAVKEKRIAQLVQRERKQSLYLKKKFLSPLQGIMESKKGFIQQ